MSPIRYRLPMPAASCRRRVSALVADLPEGRAVPMGGGHLSLEVRGRRFGWFLNDHHGDGRIALNLRAPKGAGRRLAEYAPDRFHIPKYLGRHGWIGVWLDSPALDWAEIRELIENAGQLTPPARPAKNLSSTINSTSP